MRDMNNHSGGFVKIILLTIIALVIINVIFGFDLVDYLDRDMLIGIWQDKIMPPIMFIWDKVIIGLIWNNIQKLFN